MSDSTARRTGYTKIGFSKAGFSCCGHYVLCQMGKLPCYYKEKDPEAKNYCAAYLRNQNAKQMEVPLKSPTLLKCEEVVVVVRNEEEQLSLF